MELIDAEQKIDLEKEVGITVTINELACLYAAVSNCNAETAVNYCKRHGVKYDDKINRVQRWSLHSDLEKLLTDLRNHGGK